MEKSLTKKQVRKRWLIGCGIAILIVVGIFVVLYVQGSQWIDQFDAAVVNARENFPTIQSELEEGIERLRPLLEDCVQVSFTDLDKYRDYYERKLGENTNTALEIVCQLKKTSNFSAISYSRDPYFFMFQVGTVGFIYYYYDPERQPEATSYEQLAENWYLDYGPYV